MDRQSNKEAITKMIEEGTLSLALVDYTIANQIENDKVAQLLINLVTGSLQVELTCKGEIISREDALVEVYDLFLKNA
jgi:hypothetical protein